MHNWIRYVSTKKVKSKDTFICPSAEFDLISKGGHWPFSFILRKSCREPSSWNSSQLSCVNYRPQWWVEFRGVVPWHPQILADQSTLSQPRGADYANQIILAPPHFQTFLQTWSWTMSWVGCLLTDLVLPDT
jgi:hypothetical protein